MRTWALSLLAAFLAVSIVSLSFVPVVGASPVTVYIDSVDLGYRVDSIGWAGSANIRLDTGSGPQPCKSYCVEWNQHISLGGVYTGTVGPAADTSAGRGISYILTWYHPATSDDEAYAIQAAIWKFMPGTDPTEDTSNPATRAYQIYSDALGKDVTRTGDKLTLEPKIHTVEVNTPVVLTARLVDSSGNPRSNVRILFSTTMGSLNHATTTTDSSGEATVVVTSSVPGMAQVKAETKGNWTYVIDLGSYQDIIPLGCPTLSATTQLWVIGEITFFAVPEMAMGTVSATGICLLALTIARKLKTKG